MRYPWLTHTGRFVQLKPTVGQLLDLCEENYRLLMALAPQMSAMRGSATSAAEGQMDLHLEILEQTPYTSVIHLTYYFTHPRPESRPDPDAMLRVYHDARQIEVIDLKQNVLPVEGLYQHPGLLNRWRLNVFLSKWLNYCVQQGYCFYS